MKMCNPKNIQCTKRSNISQPECKHVILWITARINANWFIIYISMGVFSNWVVIFMLNIYLPLFIFTRSYMNTLGPGDVYIDGLVEDCSNSSALAMELLQSCTKPLIRIRNMCHHFSGYGLWPVRRQAITCNDFELLSVVTPNTKLSDTWVKIQALIQESVF